MDNQSLIFIRFAGSGRLGPTVNSDPDPVGAGRGWLGSYGMSGVFVIILVVQWIIGVNMDN